MQNRFQSNVSEAARLLNVQDDIQNEPVQIYSKAEAGLHASLSLGGAKVCSFNARFLNHPGLVRRINGTDVLAEKLNTFKVGDTLVISGRTQSAIRYGRVAGQPWVELTSLELNEKAGAEPEGA